MKCEILSDRTLAQRLERAEGLANKAFVEARARLMPETGATWITVAGALAMYDGAESPCTQTFGLGMFQLPTKEEMQQIEQFFALRAAPVYHEISPLADKALLPILNERSYHPLEMSTVMCLPLASRVLSPTPIDSAVTVRVVEEQANDIWARTGAAGWSETPETLDMMMELMRISRGKEGGVNFIAEIAGQPAAAASLSIHHGVALFAGASTLPQWRKRGAQRALLEARFDYAGQVGCDLAMMAAEPGSSSQRNAERSGFRIVYTRTKWRLETKAKE